MIIYGLSIPLIVDSPSDDVLRRDLRTRRRPGSSITVAEEISRVMKRGSREAAHDPPGPDSSTSWNAASATAAAPAGSLDSAIARLDPLRRVLGPSHTGPASSGTGIQERSALPSTAHNRSSAPAKACSGGVP